MIDRDRGISSASTGAGLAAAFSIVTIRMGVWGYKPSPHKFVDVDDTKAVTMTTIPTMTAPPSISPSSTSSSPLPPPLRYVPQGTASLSSDAPGWSAATVANDEENSAAAAAAVRGPVCWKCRGGRFLAAVSATSSLPRPRGQSKTKRANNQHHNDNNNDDEIIASLLQPQPRPRQQLRECPVCAGAGHLPIKLKYLQSMTEMTGVITPRRRGRTSRQTGWEEFGHIPGAVRAALHLLSTTTTVTTSTTAKRVDCLSSEGVVEGDIVINNNNNIGNNEAEPNATVTYDDDDDDDDDAILRYAITLLSHACRPNDMNESSDETNGNHKRKDIPVSAAMTYQQGHRRSHPHPIPTWLPTNPGEQLCNLVGHWRILQRKASHRWTTDDIVTAYVAASTFVSSLFTRKNYRDDGDTSITDEGGEDNGIQKIRYLDLGTGNASVLQMVTWYLLSSSSPSPKSRGCMTKTQMQLKAVGVEARSEAVNLARRSLSFNLGAVELDDTKYCGGVVGIVDSVNETMVDSKECNVQIVQGDFRDLISLADASTKNDESNAQDGLMSMADVASKRYDLITGTPPYFRVGFTTTSTTQDKGFERTTDDNLEVVTSAVIEQGGMPTSMQSAPARCEFRGGIEAYCLAASALLSSPHGIFVVCENWANDDRVWKGAAEAGLIIESVLPVCGGGKAKQRQGNNILFAVYVMKKKIEEDALAAEDRNRDVDEVEAMKNCMQHTLVVRDENGKWTEEYAKVMNSMSIPTE